MFDWKNVSINESTFRVDSTRVADLKSRALCAYFAPQELVWSTAQRDSKEGQMVAWVASANPSAIISRLDVVFGQDGWKEEYETVDKDSDTNYSVRCTMSVRFTPESEWVARCAVGSGNDPKKAYTEAFERAAVKYGIGRYLYDLPLIHCAYSEGFPIVPPEIPQGCLPLAYRWCGAHDAKTLIGMIESCLNHFALDKIQSPRFFEYFLSEFGYRSNTALDKVIVLDYRRMMEQVLAWQEDIAARRSNGLFKRYIDLVQLEQSQARERLLRAKLPTDGEAFAKALEASEAYLVKDGALKPGELLEFLGAEAKRRAFSADTLSWSPIQIEIMVQVVKDFKSQLPKKPVVSAPAAKKS